MVDEGIPLRRERQPLIKGGDSCNALKERSFLKIFFNKKKLTNLFKIFCVVCKTIELIKKNYFGLKYIYLTNMAAF